MKTRNLLIAIIVLLLLVNIGTLTFIWINRPGQERERTGASEFLARELRLNHKQQLLHNAMLLNHRNAMKKLQDKDQNLHTRFFDLLKTNPSDTLRGRQMADSIAKLRVLMEISTFRYFDQVRRILDQPQQERFDSIFQELVRMVLPVPPPPPPPPPPPAADLPPPPPPPPDAGK
ncbi:MAG: hypothetical protein WCO93_00700 [bacterium]